MSLDTFADENRVLVVEVPESGETLDTFYAPINLDFRQGNLLVSFDYRLNHDLAPLVIVSGAPGAGQPAIKQANTFVADGKWHQATYSFDVRNMPDQAVVEILIEGYVEAGTRLEVKGVEVWAPNQAGTKVKLVSPASRQIISGINDEIIVLDIESASREVFNLAILSAQKDIVWAEQVTVEGSKRVHIPTSEWPLDDYVLEACHGLGECEEWPMQRLASQTPHVAIHNQTVRVNGAPFFPIGLYHTGDPILQSLTADYYSYNHFESPPTRDELFSQLVEQGFNVVHYSWGAPSDAYLDAADRHGLMVIAETNMDLASIPRLRDHPALFGYYFADEPHPSQANQLANVYQQYHQLDPYHPVMTAINNGGLGFGDNRFIDIAMPNMYPVTGPDANFESVVSSVQNAEQVLFKSDPRSAVVVVPQLFTADQWNGYEPSYDQVRANVYAALVAGAKGVVYYAYWTHESLQNGMSQNANRKHWYLPESGLWDSLPELNLELHQLAPAILEGTPINIKSDYAGDQIKTRALLFEDDIFVIIVNVTSDVISDVNIWIPPVDELSAISPEKYTSCHSDKLDDVWREQVSFEAYDVKIYHVSLGHFRTMEPK